MFSYSNLTLEGCVQRRPICPPATIVAGLIAVQSRKKGKKLGEVFAEYVLIGHYTTMKPFRNILTQMGNLVPLQVAVYVDKCSLAFELMNDWLLSLPW